MLTEKQVREGEREREGQMFGRKDRQEFGN